MGGWEMNPILDNPSKNSLRVVAMLKHQNSLEIGKGRYSPIRGTARVFEVFPLSLFLSLSLSIA
jgi:hypothetical protein